MREKHPSAASCTPPTGDVPATKAWCTGGQTASRLPRDQKPKRGSCLSVCAGARPFESLRRAGGFRKAWGTSGQTASWCTREAGRGIES
ncbi:hypothetical protein QTO34_012802 [Cnephaeus nilssonii]|uniref:Uncharacterized protein n=1 Tax=Cnephaeus nilssonii TaxID=3371016 RepID=A0AA40HBA6_CNENI|nr:hypothetical protein QTO34_012802 [Eptesicus nilssonii]